MQSSLKWKLDEWEMENKYLTINPVIQIIKKSNYYPHCYLISFTSILISFASHLLDNPLLELI